MNRPILAFDCSGAACSTAVVEGSKVLAERFAAMERGQSETLLPQIRDTLADAGIAFSGLRALAVTTGPGSFTGIRIGLAAARGLALATGLPIRAVSAFAAYRAAVVEAELGPTCLLVVIDSRRGPVFVQRYDTDGREIEEAGAAEPADALDLPEGNWLVAGDGAALLPPRPRPDIRIVPTIARLTARWVAAAAANSSEGPASPLYLRPPDVTQPRQPAR